MVGTCLREKKVVALAAQSIPVVADASTQTELLRGEGVVQASDCWKCLNLLPGAGSGPACQRCAQMEDLLQMVAELQESVRRLCSIREAEEELAGF